MSLVAWADEKVGTAGALVRLAEMPEAAHGRAVPWPFLDKAGIKAAASNRRINSLINAPAPLRRVRLDELHAIQHSVNADRVKQYILDPAMVPHGARSSRHRGLVDYPIVIRHAGALAIWDGHHRLVADMLRGKETAVVRFVDLGGTDEEPERP